MTRKVSFDALCFASMEGKGWTFANISAEASEMLGTRAMCPVNGTINGFAFSTSAQPDGKGGHHFMVNKKMREGAGITQGEKASFVLWKGSSEVIVDPPEELLVALSGSDAAHEQWGGITPKAKVAWIEWITSAKRQETREKRIGLTVERLAGGAKRPSE